jgi:RNA polymerase sigma factor (sigma-70 family)
MDAAAAPGAALHPPGLALRVLRDEKLATMVAEGNDDAFATLYQRHHQGVYRYCLSLLRSEADARDALQSSMLAALSALRARGIEGAFKPWLFRIAHNESVSIIRGRVREAPSEAPPVAPSTDDRETREQLRGLVADLAALPERQRGAIVMRELSGLSYAEIAAALGTSEAGGKQLVYEARGALQDLQAGHDMSCDLVRERISARDRRLLRGRKVRSHLRGCQPCQDFEQAIDHRRKGFALLAPPLMPLVAAAVLEDIFGGGGTGGGVAAGGTAGATGIASGGASVAGPAALKVAAAALIVGGTGFGAYQAANAVVWNSPTEAVAEQSADGAGPSGDRAGSGGGNGKSEGRGDGAGDGHAAAPGKADGPATSGQGGGQNGTPGSVDEPGSPSGSPGSGGSDGGGNGPGTGPSPDPNPPPPSGGGGGSPPPSGGGGGSPPPSGGGGGSPPPTGGGGPAPGTPPGHGGTPPGQGGGTPPGQAGGGTPPGQINNPGHGHG